MPDNPSVEKIARFPGLFKRIAGKSGFGFPPAPAEIAGR
jgi:hypothetical protein